MRTSSKRMSLDGDAIADVDGESALIETTAAVFVVLEDVDVLHCDVRDRLVRPGIAMNAGQ